MGDFLQVQPKGHFDLFWQSIVTSQLRYHLFLLFVAFVFAVLDAAFADERPVAKICTVVFITFRVPKGDFGAVFAFEEGFKALQSKFFAVEGGWNEH